MKAILGIKKGMTRVIRDGKQIPVTVVDVANCKLAKIDGEYSVLGLGQKKKSNKAMEGQYKELGFVPKYTKTLKGLIEGLKTGSDVLPTLFTQDEVISVKGVSKGKGFAGVVKRHGFKGGSRTRGQSDRLRAPGSIGAGTTPGRVFKGTRMGGRMGSESITLKNKKIVDINDTYMLISGPIPGSNGDLITILSE